MKNKDEEIVLDRDSENEVDDAFNEWLRSHEKESSDDDE